MTILMMTSPALPAGGSVTGTTMVDEAAAVVEAGAGRSVSNVAATITGSDRGAGLSGVRAAGAGGGGAGAVRLGGIWSGSDSSRPYSSIEESVSRIIGEGSSGSRAGARAGAGGGGTGAGAGRGAA